VRRAKHRLRDASGQGETQRAKKKLKRAKKKLKRAKKKLRDAC
jgi:hypothetical protein